MTAASTRAAVQTLLNAPNPGVGVQTGMVTAMLLAAAELDAEGIERPESLGQGIYAGRDGVNAAAAGAQANGEPGMYVGRHDGRVYTPGQMVATLHRYLLALGWITTSTQPPAAGSADAPALYPPATWRAALDQGGLANTHTPLTGGDPRSPLTIPLGRVIDVAAYRLPGGRPGRAFAANVPAGATKIEAQPIPPAPVAGQQRWYGFSFQLSRSYPLSDTRSHILARFRNNDGSHVIGLQAFAGQLWLTSGTAALAVSNPRPVGEIDTQVWHDVIWRVTFNYGVAGAANAGSTDVYLDGVLGQSYQGPTLPGIGVAPLRYGLCRDPAAPNEACVYHMGWAMGSSLGSVLLPGAG